MIPAGPSPHLHVVLNDPIDYPKKGGETVLLVSWCSHTGGLQDQTCLVQVGEHAFVTNPTYVEYSLASLRLAPDVERKVTTGIYWSLAPISEPLYDRILQGFRQSRRVERGIINFMNFAGL